MSQLNATIDDVERREGGDVAQHDASSVEAQMRRTRSSSRGELSGAEGGNRPTPSVADITPGVRRTSRQPRAGRSAKRAKSSNRSRSPRTPEGIDDGDSWDSEKTVSEESTDEESSGERARFRDAKRKERRGRPALKPENVGKFTAEARAERTRQEKEQRQEEDEERAVDPTVAIRFGPRLAKARREEEELLRDYKETSPAGLTAVMTEQVTALRRLAQNCTNLKGTAVKALWDASTSIAAASTALHLRARSSGNVVTAPEWEDLREEVRQLRGDLTHLRAENEALKAELKRERTEREKLERKAEKEKRDDNARGIGEGGVSHEPSLDSNATPASSARPKRQVAARTNKVIDSSEDEDMEVGVEGARSSRCPSPPPDPASLLHIGEVIPPAYRPPLGGVRVEIEPAKVYEGPKALTVNDLSAALEVLLPRMFTRMGLTPPVGEGSGMPPSGSDPGSAPSLGGRASTGSREIVHPQPSRQSSAAAVTGISQSSAAASGDGAKAKKRKGKKKNRKERAEGGGNPTGVSGQPGPFVPAPPKNLPVSQGSGGEKRVTPPSRGEAGGPTGNSGSQTAPQQEQWSLVVGRRAKGGRQPAAAGANNKGGQNQGGNKTMGQTNANRLRAPKSAAVCITCPAGSYAETLKLAKERVSIRELGIESLKNRRAVTGALLLEVMGPNGERGADQLASKLKEVLAGKEGVKVDRPIKKAEIRVKDLDDATTAADVAAAVAAFAECDVGAVKAGTPSRPPKGLATCRVQAPVAVVKKVVAAGRLQVGWCQSRVELLEARPLTCFRCLEEGHTRSQCRSAIDRSGLCYRCGGVGHAAKACTGQVCCPVCTLGDSRVTHRLGGEACLAAQRKRRKGGRSAQGKARAPAVPSPSIAGHTAQEAAPEKTGAAVEKAKGEEAPPKEKRPTRVRSSRSLSPGGASKKQPPRIVEVEMVEAAATKKATAGALPQGGKGVSLREGVAKP